MNTDKFLTKLSRLASRQFNKVNACRLIAESYFNRVNRAEYAHPPFTAFNERPVEYGFVFAAIAKYYPKRILDIGTGITALPHLMANCGCAVTAIDNIEDYWQDGMFNRHFLVLNDDIRDTKLTAKFDLVACISTLEHIDRFNESVANMAKLLNPEGLLILTFPYNEHEYQDNAYALAGSNGLQQKAFKTHIYSRRELNNWCDKNGLEIIEQNYWQAFTGPYWSVGERIIPPQQVSKEQAHHLSCVLFKKL